MRIRSILAAPLLLSALLVGTACDDPGPAEKAGQAIDDAADDITHPNEGPMEKAGREIDESVETAKDKLEKAKAD